MINVFENQQRSRIIRVIPFKVTMGGTINASILLSYAFRMAFNSFIQVFNYHRYAFVMWYCFHFLFLFDNNLAAPYPTTAPSAALPIELLFCICWHGPILFFIETTQSENVSI